MLSLYVVMESCGEGYKLLSVCRSLSGVTRSIDGYFGGVGSYDVLNRYDVGEFGVEYVLDISFKDLGVENFTKVVVRRVNVFDGFDCCIVSGFRLELFFWLFMLILFIFSFYNLLLC